MVEKKIDISNLFIHPFQITAISFPYVENCGRNRLALTPYPKLYVFF